MAPPSEVAGLLLAAGAGRRMGTPKALLRTADGTPQALVAARALRSGGCSSVLVVLGAAAADAALLLGDHASPGEVVATVTAPGWTQGMGVSLRTGLQTLEAHGGAAEAVLVSLVDLPDVTAAVHARVLQRWRTGGSAPDALLRATYAGRPGHPVLIGRHHWARLASELAGDTGAQRYLVRHRVRSVSCEDLATGRDVDRPEDLAADGQPG